MGLLVEQCLLEWNGTNVGKIGFNHGIYAGGTNGVYRNNVCRYNGGYGMVLSSHADTDKNNRIYNNLMYGNSTGSGADDQLALYNDQASPPKSGSWTNYVYGNTLISRGAYAVIAQDGMIVFTNNIILSTNDGVHRFDSYTSDVIAGNYNVAPQALGYSGPSDVVTNYFGFVSTTSGLYWLTSDSPARGVALAGVAGPVNFFGNAQSSVADIGAFQYKAAYASDSRVLDPSPANPDYWANLAGTNGGSAAITVTPASQSFGSIAVGSTEDQTFTVQNIGSETLSGSASVSAPFGIVSGGSYNLGAGLSQVVTVRYSPTTAGSDMATVAFTATHPP